MRLIINRYQRTRTALANRRDPESLTSTSIRQTAPRPTLLGTARLVTDRMFVGSPRQQQDSYVPYHRRDLDRDGDEGVAVVRHAEDGDPDLPAYCQYLSGLGKASGSYEGILAPSTLPAAPEPAHQSIMQVRRDEGHTDRPMLPLFGEEPPKYTTDGPVRTL